MNKKLFQTRNLIVVGAIVAVGAGAFIFQNCGSSSGTSNSSTVATSSVGSSCVLPATVVWTVGANTCTASGGTTITDGSSVTVVGVSPSVGSATFSCAAGSLSGAFGSTCTTGCTSSACLANGVCGADNGLGLSSAPVGALNLCAAGTASAISGTGPWTWSCVGNNGGSTVSCQATVGTTASTGGTSSTASLVAPCTVPAYSYPLGSGFLMNTQNGYGNVCCVPSPSENGVANGLGWYCVDSPTWETASTSGPATPLPAGSGCTLNLVSGYPAGAGVISYTHSGVELCCGISHPWTGNGDGKGWYCEPSNATTAVASAGATQAGTPCSVSSITTYGNNSGITLYTSAAQRVCCEIGAGYGGPGDGKGWYCEAY